MNHSLYLDPPLDDDARRLRLFAGQLLVYAPRPTTLALVRLARELIEAAFGARDPRTAQHEMPVDAYAALLQELKPRFIHHPEAKRLLRELLEDVGCDLQKTYFDLPRMRSSTSDGYLTTGIAYAWHPHRDTWYSAPSCQLNWWTPIYEVTSENTMAFHPQYFSRPVKNDSARYNYYEWNRVHRGAHVSQYTKSDPRPLPKPQEEIELDPQLRLVVPVGSLILFSGAQMHSSVPNTSGVTRFSIDFRTVNSDDLALRRGAPNVDSACTGTTMRDYLRGSDLTRVPEPLVAAYDDGTAGRGQELYVPKSA
jgi:hypothetical protein